MTTLQGKVALVTGATNGIGAVTARELARRGATVVGVGRDPQRSAAMAAQIKAETGSATVEFLVADLSAQAGVRGLAEAFMSRYNRLHILVNNAGAFNNQRQVSPDGIELTFALNHLNYFLLTNLLLDTLKASAPARIVNVSSAAHQGSHLDFTDLEGKARYSGWEAYGQSKLANVLFTYELARRLAGTGVTANALHPGFVATRFGHNNGGVVSFGLGLVQRLVAKTPEQGAQTSLYLASAPEVEGVTGQYFSDQKAVRSSEESYDVKAAQRLWEISEQMTALRVQK